MSNKQQETGLKIVGLDIETTGLSGKRFERNNSDLLEIGLVLYDVKEHRGKSFKQLDLDVPKIRIIVHRPTKYLQGGFFAFNMHKDTILPLHQRLDNEDIFEIKMELQSKLKENETVFICKPDDIISTMIFALYEHGWATEEDLERKALKNALTVAGKNVSGFDLPYLRDYIPEFAWRVKARTRVYDPTVIFANDDMDRLPSLDECLNLAREYNYDFPKGSVSHTAVEDAMNIINLIHLQKQRGLQLKGKMKHTSSDIGLGADNDKYD